MTEQQNNVSTAKLVITNDEVHLVDNDQDLGALEITKDGICYILPPNSSNRKWFSIKKVEAARSNNIDTIVLEYKASRVAGSCKAHMPNEKLISYLPEDLQAEYKAIVDRAIAARDAEKTKPMTELEKAQAKLEKAKAALAKLQEQAANN